MTVNGPVIALVEWLSDSFSTPAVFLADTVQAAERAVVAYLAAMTITGLDEDFHTDWPVPDLDDADAIRAWIAAKQEATTDAWISLYAQGGSPADAGGATYVDVRAASTEFPYTAALTPLEVERLIRTAAELRNGGEHAGLSQAQAAVLDKVARLYRDDMREE